jgi:hypothetical protein
VQPGRSGPGRRRSRREGKKGLAARIEEIAAAEVGRLAGLAAGMLGGSPGLGVLEQAMRAALATAGAAMLQAVLDEQDDGYAGPRAGCGCGGQAAYAGSRPKTVTTVLGPVHITRAWYHCAACQHGFAPRDRQLGLRASGALSRAWPR